MARPRIEETVRLIRNRVRREDGYLNSEFRTKYILIDPILRTLGWDTSDPAKVQMEFRCPQMDGIPDYALFKTTNNRKPSALVEAKPIHADTIRRFKDRITSFDTKVIEGFKELQSPGSDVAAENRETIFDEDTWTSQKKANEGQIEGYVKELKMNDGYAVLTNGDDWWIYDLVQYELGTKSNNFADALIWDVSILFDPTEKVKDVLKHIGFDRKWPGI